MTRQRAHGRAHARKAREARRAGVRRCCGARGRRGTAERARTAPRAARGEDDRRSRTAASGCGRGTSAERWRCVRKPVWRAAGRRERAAESSRTRSPRACSACLRRSWLLSELARTLRLQCRDRERLSELLALERRGARCRPSAVGGGPSSGRDTPQIRPEAGPAHGRGLRRSAVTIGSYPRRSDGMRALRGC